MVSSVLLAALVNFLTAAAGLGMALIVLWQDARSSTNRLFGGFLLALCAYGLTSGVSRYPTEFDLNLGHMLRISTVCFVWSLSLLLLFNFEFAASKRRWSVGMQGVVIALAVSSTLYFATGPWFADPHITSSGHVSYHTSTLTKVIMGLTIGLMLTSAGALWRSPRPGGRDLAGSVILIPVGFSAFFVPLVEDLPMLSITLAIVAILTTRVVLRLQLFDPLARLNRELAAANAHLNTTLQQLAASNADLADANRRQGDFLARMSHELRTPLNAIIGFSELLLNNAYGPLTEKQIDRVRHVHRNSRNLLNLINDLLDLSKISAGHMTLDRRRLHPTRVLDDVAETVQPLVHSKGLVLRRAYGDLPPISADEARFRQILINLLSNAVKFTEHGSVTIGSVVQDGTIRFSVTDTGIGIPVAQIAHVFDEFYQVAYDGGVHPPAQGTGLGLAIVRQLVELHEGHIWVESTVGAGSTFYFNMPLAAEVSSQPADPAPESPSRSPAQGRLAHSSRAST